MQAEYDIQCQKSKMILKLNGSIPYFITHINYFELDVNQSGN